MELWDLYTKYRENTKKEWIRGEIIPEGFFHLVVHVWIRNSKGEYLISRRAPTRPTFPLLWECAGGSVIKGESSIEGALRETKEEIGIDLRPEDGKILFSKIRGINVMDEGKGFNDIMDVWLFTYDGALRLQDATTDEVSACRWMTIPEIQTLQAEQKFVPTLDYFPAAVTQSDIPDYRSIIGKTVTGIIDRPIGSPHPRFPKTIYPVNYGYVEEIFAGDGKEQDIYLFGTDTPVTRFKGKVIAVYHRFNDSEDKWIVSLNDDPIPDEKILGDIFFQEQYYYGKLYR